MRITDKMIQRQMLAGLQKATERMTNSQERVSTSKNIKRPSDDPIGFMQIMSYRRDLQKLQQTIKNAENASMGLSQNDAVLQEVSEIMLDARNTAAIMSTDTVSGEDRLAMVNEMQLMINDMFQSANTRFGGRYIFSGHKIFTQPYQEDNGEIEYFGDQGRIEQRIEFGDPVSVSIPGSEIFGTSTEGIFRTLKDLKTALETNDVPTIKSSLTAIDEEIDRVAAVRGEIGMKIKRVENSIDQLSSIEPTMVSNLSKIEDVNMVMESVEYLDAQEAYQLTLQTTASTIKLPSLIDFLT